MLVYCYILINKYADGNRKPFNATVQCEMSESIKGYKFKTANKTGVYIYSIPSVNIYMEKFTYKNIYKSKFVF